MKKAVMYFSLIVPFFFSITFGLTPSDVMPLNNELPGWMIDSTVAGCKNGTAQDSSGLYDLIDGGDGIYHKHGFKGACIKSFVLNSIPDAYICVWIFDQTNATKAKELYKDPEIDNSTFEKVSGIGDSARIDMELLVEYQLEIIHNNFYMKINTAPKNDVMKQFIKDMGALITRKITPLVNLPHSTKNASGNLLVTHQNNRFVFSLEGKAISFQNAVSINIVTSNGRIIHTLNTSGKNKVFWNGTLKNSQISKGSYIATTTIKGVTYSTPFVVE